MKLSTFAKRTVTALWAVVVLVFASGRESAEGATDTTGLQVTAAVLIRCSVGTAEMAFGGGYESGQAAPLDMTTSIIVMCDPGRKVAIKLSQGLYPAPGSTDNNPLRRMANGTHRISYNLYEDAARTIVWDNRNNTVKTTRVFPYTATVYGRIPGGQYVYPGAYSDTVIATVHY